MVPYPFSLVLDDKVLRISGIKSFRLVIECCCYMYFVYRIEAMAHVADAFSSLDNFCFAKKAVGA